MKKAIFIPLMLLFIACADDAGVENSGSGDNHHGDTVTSTPTAIDTVQHPNGVTSGSVISTDTAAMRVDTSVRR